MGKIHRVFHVNMLKPYSSSAIPNRHQAPPPPIEIEGEEEYEVEKIQDSRIYRGKLQYLVKWKGYGPRDMTWEPRENVSNAKELVEEFHRKYPRKPMDKGKRRALSLETDSEVVNYIGNLREEMSEWVEGRFGARREEGEEGP